MTIKQNKVKKDIKKKLKIDIKTTNLKLASESTTKANEA